MLPAVVNANSADRLLINHCFIHVYTYIGYDGNTEKCHHITFDGKKIMYMELHFFVFQWHREDTLNIILYPL